MPAIILVNDVIKEPGRETRCSTTTPLFSLLSKMRLASILFDMSNVTDAAPFQKYVKLLRPVLGKQRQFRLIHGNVEVADARAFWYAPLARMAFAEERVARCDRTERVVNASARKALVYADNPLPNLRDADQQKCIAKLAEYSTTGFSVVSNDHAMWNSLLHAHPFLYVCTHARVWPFLRSLEFRSFEPLISGDAARVYGKTSSPVCANQETSYAKRAERTVHSITRAPHRHWALAHGAAEHNRRVFGCTFPKALRERRRRIWRDALASTDKVVLMCSPGSPLHHVRHGRIFCKRLASYCRNAWNVPQTEHNATFVYETLHDDTRDASVLLMELAGMMASAAALGVRLLRVTSHDDWFSTHIVPDATVVEDVGEAPSSAATTRVENVDETIRSRGIEPGSSLRMHDANELFPFIRPSRHPTTFVFRASTTSHPALLPTVVWDYLKPKGRAGYSTWSAPRCAIGRALTSVSHKVCARCANTFGVCIVVLWHLPQHSGTR